VDSADGDVGSIAAAVRVAVDLSTQAFEAPDLGDCPRCNCRLCEETIRAVRLQRCETCGGRFVPLRSLGGAVLLAPEDFAKPLPLGDVLAAWLRWLRRSP
jgi:hypothetical protein